MLRIKHKKLLSRETRNIGYSALKALLFVPRVFFIVYELIINVLLYFPLRIVNWFLNKEDVLLSPEKQAQVAAALSKMEIKFIQDEKNAIDDTEFRLKIKETKETIKTYHCRNTAHRNLLLLNSTSISDAITRGFISEKVFHHNNVSQGTELIAFASAAGFFGRQARKMMNKTIYKLETGEAQVCPSINC